MLPQLGSPSRHQQQLQSSTNGAGGASSSSSSSSVSVNRRSAGSRTASGVNGSTKSTVHSPLAVFNNNNNISNNNNKESNNNSSMASSIRSSVSPHSIVFSSPSPPLSSAHVANGATRSPRNGATAGNGASTQAATSSTTGNGHRMGRNRRSNASSIIPTPSLTVTSSNPPSRAGNSSNQVRTSSTTSSTSSNRGSSQSHSQSQVQSPSSSKHQSYAQSRVSVSPAAIRSAAIAASTTQTQNGGGFTNHQHHHTNSISVASSHAPTTTAVAGRTHFPSLTHHSSHTTTATVPLSLTPSTTAIEGHHSLPPSPSPSVADGERSSASSSPHKKKGLGSHTHSSKSFHDRTTITPTVVAAPLAATTTVNDSKDKDNNKGNEIEETKEQSPIHAQVSHSHSSDGHTHGNGNGVINDEKQWNSGKEQSSLDSGGDDTTNSLIRSHSLTHNTKSNVPSSPLLTPTSLSVSSSSLSPLQVTHGLDTSVPKAVSDRPILPSATTPHGSTAINTTHNDMNDAVGSPSSASIARKKKRQTLGSLKAVKQETDVRMGKVRMIEAQRNGLPIRPRSQSAIVDGLPILKGSNGNNSMVRTTSGSGGSGNGSGSMNILLTLHTLRSTGKISHKVELRVLALLAEGNTEQANTLLANSSGVTSPNDTNAAPTNSNDTHVRFAAATIANHTSNNNDNHATTKAKSAHNVPESPQRRRELVPSRSERRLRLSGTGKVMSPTLTSSPRSGGGNRSSTNGVSNSGKRNSGNQHHNHIGSPNHRPHSAGRHGAAHRHDVRRSQSVWQLPRTNHDDTDDSDDDTNGQDKVALGMDEDDKELWALSHSLLLLERIRLEQSLAPDLHTHLLTAIEYLESAKNLCQMRTTRIRRRLSRRMYDFDAQETHNVVAWLSREYLDRDDGSTMNGSGGGMNGRNGKRPPPVITGGKRSSISMPSSPKSMMAIAKVGAALAAAAAAEAAAAVGEPISPLDIHDNDADAGDIIATTVPHTTLPSAIIDVATSAPQLTASSINTNDSSSVVVTGNNDVVVPPSTPKNVVPLSSSSIVTTARVGTPAAPSTSTSSSTSVAINTSPSMTQRRASLAPPPTPPLPPPSLSSSSSLTISPNAASVSAAASSKPLSPLSALSQSLSPFSYSNTASSSSNNSNNQGHPGAMYLPMLPSSELSQLLSSCMSWDFDIFRLATLTNGRPLSVLGGHLLHVTGLGAQFSLSVPQVLLFLSGIEDGYPANPYHNSVHGADVLQNMAFFLQAKVIRDTLSPEGNIFIIG
jgi:hypothetical protein